jgi:GTPase SAR1 family protein
VISLSFLLCFFFDIFQDRFQNLARNYYREASGAIIVFDQTLPRSFSKILDWKDDLVTKGGQLPIIVMQNKCDLPMHADIPAHDAMIQWAITNGNSLFPISKLHFDLT